MEVACGGEIYGGGRGVGVGVGFTARDGMQQRKHMRPSPPLFSVRVVLSFFLFF